MHADILILGAGVVGASVAYHLARAGVRHIVVLDRANAFGGGSTSKATGGFRAQFDNETEVRLSLVSRAKLLAFEEETGVDSGYRQHGYLFLACSDAEFDALRAAHAIQRACGVESRIVDADEARALNRHIGDPFVVGGSFCGTDGFLRPMNILRGYVEAAQRLGVRFELGVEHQGFLVEGDRVVAVRTANGDRRARIFVNALGAWSGAPVTPMRRNVAMTIATDVLPESMPMTIWSGDWYHLRVRDGRVLLLWPDDPPFPHWLRNVLRMTRERMPCLEYVPIDDCWSGLYEMTPDGHALLGPVRDNVYVATGCSGHGVMHAPALGQLLAEMIVEGKASMDLSALDPLRFAAGTTAG